MSPCVPRADAGFPWRRAARAAGSACRCRSGWAPAVPPVIPSASAAALGRSWFGIPPPARAFCLRIRLQPSLRFVPRFIGVGTREMGLVVPWGPQDSLCPPCAGGFALKQLGTGRGTAK